MGGVVAAHAVDSGAGRRGGRAEVNVAGGRGVMPPCRAEEKLAEVGGAAGNVTANEVGVHLFESGGRKDAGCQDAGAATRGEKLALRVRRVPPCGRGTGGWRT